MKKEQIFGIGIVAIFAIVIGYFFFSSESVAPGEIPSYVTGEMRMIYEYANTPEGGALLEQIPCYCGCKYEGHKHTKNCYWRDDGTFDKHGITCSVCFDIATKAKAMKEEGKDVCAIRNEIDKFYEPNKHLGTETPMPAGCAAETTAESQTAEKTNEQSTNNAANAPTGLAIGKSCPTSQTDSKFKC